MLRVSPGKLSENARLVPLPGEETDRAYPLPSPGSFSAPGALAGRPSEILRSAAAMNAQMADLFFSNPFVTHNPLVPDAAKNTARMGRAWAEVTLLCSTEQPRPKFGINSVAIGAATVDVKLSKIPVSPFSNLLRFERDTRATHPRVLIVPPLSGHYDTLLRGTVEAMLPDHDVHMLSWNNFRDVPLPAGRFDLSRYINETVWSLRACGRDGAPVHVVAVCQPAVAALVAAAQMAEDGERAAPRSLTLIAGPIDTRINPTKVNAAAKSKSIEWIAENLFGTVDGRYAGAGRMVLPGLLQLTNFMAPNIEKHRKSLGELAGHIAAGRTEEADKIRNFYKEYFAVMDLPAEFIIETIDKVFHNHALPRGRFAYTDELGQRRSPDFEALRRMFLLTVEGDRDDICGLGQTEAAHELCARTPQALRDHVLIAGAGHYGAFGGENFKRQAYPVIKNMIETADSRSRLGLH